MEAKSDFDYDSTVEALRKVFGIVEICPACLTQERDFDKLSKEIIEFIDRTYEKKDFSKYSLRELTRSIH